MLNYGNTNSGSTSAYTMGSIIGGLFGLAGAGLNAWSQSETNATNRDIASQNIDFQREANAQNIAFTRETNAHNEALTRESWARDDSEIQRRVADALAAGVNPLAVLGAAGNSSPITWQSPKVDSVHNDYQKDPIHFDFSSMAFLQNLALGQAQIEDIKANAALKNSQNAIQQLNVLDLALQLDDFGFKTSSQKLNLLRFFYNFMTDSDNANRNLRHELINQITNGSFGEIPNNKVDNVVELGEKIVNKSKNYFFDPVVDFFKNTFGGKK